MNRGGMVLGLSAGIIVLIVFAFVMTFTKSARADGSPKQLREITAKEMELFEKVIPGPCEGSKHEHNAKAVCHVSQGMVVTEQPDLIEDEFPIVVTIIRLPAGDAAQEHQLLGSGIVDVRGDVHKVFTEPPQCY